MTQLLTSTRLVVICTDVVSSLPQFRWMIEIKQSFISIINYKPYEDTRNGSVHRTMLTPKDYYDLVHPGHAALGSSTKTVLWVWHNYFDINQLYPDIKPVVITPSDHNFFVFEYISNLIENIPWSRVHT